MIYFAACNVPDMDALQIHKFHTIEELFSWMQKCKDEDTDGLPPKNLTVYKAECLFDGS